MYTLVQYNIIWKLHKTYKTTIPLLQTKCVDMCDVEGKRQLCDINVTSSSPALATRHNTLCSVGQ